MIAYKQDLYKVTEYTGKRKKFEYGHDKELDIVIISRDGT